jgi:hypothetical protein
MQSVYEHRVMGKCGRLIDERAQYLIVPGRRKSQLRADGLFLGSDVAPPLSFEGQHGQVTFGQAGARSCSGAVVGFRNTIRCR